MILYHKHLKELLIARADQSEVRSSRHLTSLNGCQGDNDLHWQICIVFLLPFCIVFLFFHSKIFSLGRSSQTVILDHPHTVLIRIPLT